MALPKIFSFLKSAWDSVIVVPNINLTLPSKLPSCKEILENAPEDYRVFVRYLETFCPDKESHFSYQDFNEYDIADVGDVNIFLKKLEDMGWIEELEAAKILTILYSADELKTFLQSHDLKVSGKKYDLALRLLEKVPLSKFKRKYKHTLYCATDLGINQLHKKQSDYRQLVIDSIDLAKNKDFQGIVDIYNEFDRKWGFIHASGKAHTIFANREIPRNQFQYIVDYPMKELCNSDKFKEDFRFFLLTSLMRRHKNSSVLAKEFTWINDEPINCPNILNLYQQNRDDDMDKDYLDGIISTMKKRIKNEPDIVLEYYISNVKYNCNHSCNK